MANVKFSDIGTFPINAAPTAAQILVGYDLGASTNFAVSAQTLNEVTIPTLSNPGEFGFGSTILRNWVTGASLSAGVLYYWDYSGTANQWQRADNTTASSADSKGMLAICRNTTIDGSAMVSKGVVRVANPGVTWTAANNGNLVYVGATGLVTLVAPTITGETQRFVGYVVDGPNYVIHFDPDYTFITV